MYSTKRAFNVSRLAGQWWHLYKQFYKELHVYDENSCSQENTGSAFMLMCIYNENTLWSL